MREPWIVNEMTQLTAPVSLQGFVIVPSRQLLGLSLLMMMMMMCCIPVGDDDQWKR